MESKGSEVTGVRVESLRSNVEVLKLGSLRFCVLSAGLRSNKDSSLDVEPFV